MGLGIYVADINVVHVTLELLHLILLQGIRNIYFAFPFMPVINVDVCAIKKTDRVSGDMERTHIM